MKRSRHLVSLAVCTLGAITLNGSSAAFTFHDDLGEHDAGISSMMGDLAGGSLEIDLVTGDYSVTWQADPIFPFVGPLEFELNLARPGEDPVDLSHDWNEMSLAESLTFSGNNPGLVAWQAGDTLYTSGNVPEFPVSFTSGIHMIPVLIFLPAYSDPMNFSGQLGSVAGEPADSDGDGIPDEEDAFPESDTGTSVTLLGVETGIANLSETTVSGATLADLIQGMEADARETAKTGGDYVQQLNKDFKILVRDGYLTAKERAMLISLVAGSMPLD